MFVTDEKVISAFKEANFWGNENLFFYGAISPTIGQYFAFGALAQINAKFLIINKNENGIGIIPLDQITAKPYVDQILIISNENINNVTIEKGGFLWYKKISIVSKNNESISFKVQKNVWTLKSHKANLQKFIELYS